MHGMIKRGMVALAAVAIGVLAAGLWLAMACGQQAAGPTPQPTRPIEDPATLCASEADGRTADPVTEERALAVLREHKERFRRQPSLAGFHVEFLEDADASITDDIGIVIRVLEKADQSTLPEQYRIPSCLDGVPVQFQEGFKNEFLGGSP